MHAGHLDTIGIHHVGGRGGGGGASGNLAILEGNPVDTRDDLFLCFYEADTDAAELSRMRIDALGYRSRFLPYLVAETEGSVDFHINRCRFTSSRFPVNPDLLDWYTDVGEFDYELNDPFTTEEVRALAMHSIDHILHRHSDVPPPAFLSTDTQGSEYEILMGAERTIRRHTVAVTVEVLFQKLYQGAKTFPEVALLLDRLGFDVAEFGPITQYSPYRAPFGLRGLGFAGCSDALFLRRIDSLEADVPAPAERHALLLKLAYMALLHGFSEYALKALKAARPLAGKAAQEVRDARFRAVLDGFLDVAEAGTPVWPASYSDMNPPGEAPRRYPGFQIEETETAAERYLRAHGFNKAAGIMAGRRQKRVQVRTP